MSRRTKKNQLAIIFALLAALAGWFYRDMDNGPEKQPQKPARVISNTVNVASVADGDTITLADKRKVRYIGINTPEIVHGSKPGERFGPEAKKGNLALVSGRRVRLETDVEKTDRYGRTLAYVFRDDGVFVNEKLVEDGLAYCYPYGKNTSRAEIFLAAQRRAMDAKRGMWRSFKEPADVEYYVGNPRSMRFHKPDHYPLKSGRVKFSTMWEAYYAGMAPCNECIRGM